MSTDIYTRQAVFEVFFCFLAAYFKIIKVVINNRFPSMYNDTGRIFSLKALIYITYAKIFAREKSIH